MPTISYVCHNVSYEDFASKKACTDYLFFLTYNNNWSLQSFENLYHNDEAKFKTKKWFALPQFTCTLPDCSQRLSEREERHLHDLHVLTLNKTLLKSCSWSQTGKGLGTNIGILPAVQWFGAIIRGGRNRGVNLPSSYFLSQFLPPPFFLSQFLPPP